MKTIGLITTNYSSERFQTLTESRPLASLPFGGRYRLIDFALSNMVNSGITKVGVIAPFNSSSLVDHIGSGKPWSLSKKIDGLFMMPGSVYGFRTPGSRFVFKDIIDNRFYLDRSDAEEVIMCSGSDIYNFDFTPLIKAHRQSGCQMTVLYKKVEEAKDLHGYFLDLNEEGRVKGIAESISGPANYFMDCFIVNTGFLKDLITWYAPVYYQDMFVILSERLNKFNIGSFEFTGYFGKISSLSDYMKVSRDLTDYEVRKEVFNEDRVIFTKTQDDPPVLYEKGGSAKSSIIGAGCRISGRVEDSTIFRSTKIGEGAQLRNCVIMMHGDIGAGAVLENVICDKFVRISPGVKLSGRPDKPIVLEKGTQL